MGAVVQNRVYGREMVPVPPAEWPPILAITCRVVRVWRSRDYLAVLYGEPSGQLRLSVNSTRRNAQGEWKDGITWDELWRVKNECLGREVWCAEAYPAESCIVREHNIRHLFVLDGKPDWAWDLRNGYGTTVDTTSDRTKKPESSLSAGPKDGSETAGDEHFGGPNKKVSVDKLLTLAGKIDKYAGLCKRHDMSIDPMVARAWASRIREACGEVVA